MFPLCAVHFSLISALFFPKATGLSNSLFFVCTMFQSIWLPVLAMASVAMADHLASSVSTLDFKNRFRESGIVPEVIAALDPAVSFYAGYKAGEDGHDELLVPGSTLSATEATMPFEFSVENLNNATNITSQTRFLIYLVGSLLRLSSHARPNKMHSA